jgi:putative oxidoreductase
VIEIIATVGLVLGIYTAQVAVLAGIFLLVAAWASWKFSAGKWIWNFGGAEYPLFWGICCFVVAMQAWRT